MSSDEEYQYNIGTSGSDTSMSDDFSSSPEDNQVDDQASDSDEWIEINSINDVVPSPFHFANHSNINQSMDGYTKPLEFFNYFFDEALIKMIVEQTNKFAEQNIKDTTSNSIVNIWHPTSDNEMRIFLIIVLIQSIVVKPEEKMYWAKHPVFETPFFAKIMSYRRFILIKKFLHFSDNTEYDPSIHPNPKLNKIWPVYTHLQKKFQEGYVPEKNVTIDESLMLYKGRLGWIQYMPLKRARFGIKTYMLCESKSGYIWSTIIYTGKNTIFSKQLQNLPVSSQIVMDLMKPLLNKGHCLTTDNFYTSPELAEILIKNKTDTYGTLRVKRKGVPKNISFPKKVSKGFTKTYRKGKVMVMRWRDKKDVFFLSTIHGCSMIEIDNGIKKHLRPKVANDYNFSMGGVDRVDQHLSIRPVPRKQGKKFYKKMFFHMMEQALWNAFVLFVKSGGKFSNLKFREKLIEQYLEKYHTPEFASKGGRPSITPNPLRLTERHFIELLPPTESKMNASKRCIVCCSKTNERGKKIRKETRYYCPDCNVGLCIPCFKIYHTKRVY